MIERLADANEYDRRDGISLPAAARVKPAGQLFSNPRAAL
jgi:hypothetical protein